MLSIISWSKMFVNLMELDFASAMNVCHAAESCLLISSCWLNNYFIKMESSSESQ